MTSHHSQCWSLVPMVCHPSCPMTNPIRDHHHSLDPYACSASEISFLLSLRWIFFAGVHKHVFSFHPMSEDFKWTRSGLCASVSDGATMKMWWSQDKQVSLTEQLNSPTWPCVLDHENSRCTPQILTLCVPTHIWTSCNSHQHSQSTPQYRSRSWFLWGSAPKTRDPCRSKKRNASHALVVLFRNSWASTSTEWLCGSYDRSKTKASWPDMWDSLRLLEWQGSKLYFHHLLSRQLENGYTPRNARISPQIPCALEMLFLSGMINTYTTHGHSSSSERLLLIGVSAQSCAPQNLSTFRRSPMIRILDVCHLHYVL